MYNTYNSNNNNTIVKYIDIKHHKINLALKLVSLDNKIINI